MIETILAWGASSHFEARVNAKIRLTNAVALFFVVMCLVYIGIALTLLPPILPYILIAIFFFCLVPFLNKWGFKEIARFITAVNPALVSFFIHITVVNVGETPISGNYLIQLSFSLLPWVLYDLKEKALLFSSFILTVLAVGFVRPLSGLVESETANALVRSILFENLFLWTACFLVGATLFILHLFIQNSEKENQRLIKEAEDKEKTILQDQAKLNAYIEQVEGARKQEQQREWTNAGLASLGELLRDQSLSMDDLYARIVSAIVKYAKATQGCLFVAEEKGNEGALLELKACYAYARNRFVDARVHSGEGLVGQIFLEKEPVMITEVPQGYTTITSGLGDATPRCLVIIPLCYNEEAIGVMEIASLDTFEPFQLQYLYKAADTLAASISGLMVNERTKVLLAQSQQQTEVLRAQEEEMRQNMEELSATQEETERKERQVQVQMIEYQKREEALRTELQRLQRMLADKA